MYGKIYQIDTKPIKREDYINTAREGEMVVSFSYVYETRDEERSQFMHDLAEGILPKGMFSLDSDGETLIFQGGFDKWKRHYLELIRLKAAAIDEGNIMEGGGTVNQLQKVISNPIGCDAYFVTDFHCGAVAVNSRDFMAMVGRLEPGSKLYVGSILYYHAY